MVYRADRTETITSNAYPFIRAETLIGYLHPNYAASLAEFGKPRLLPKSGGWILERQIPGFAYSDGISCYPLFACQNWSQLYFDLEDIGSDLVSLAVVTDPFGEYDATNLWRCFKDVVIPFKEHFIFDLHQDVNTCVSHHHRRNARKALQSVQVEVCQNPMQFINEWIDLYSILIRKYSIRGIPAFSRSSFEEQLKVPGIVVLRAVHETITVGMTLWYIKGDVSYYHLGAYNELGYKLGTSFALFWKAIEYFAAGGLRWLSLGAAAGITSKDMDGLTRFKRGWSTETRTAYFCGRIFDRKKYSEIMETIRVSPSDYFPMYRKDEFR
jgi:hypothetical protein